MNKEIQVFKDQQLIPLRQNENGQVIIDGRELHDFLKVKQDFSDWIKKQLSSVNAEENKDYCTNPFKRERQILIEYSLNIDIAKEICMVAGVAPRSNEETKELSKQARRYFIQVDKAWNSPEMVMKRALEFANKKVEKLMLENSSLLEEKRRNTPKVIFADAVSTSKSSILVGELSKILKQNGVDIGGQRLFAWLRENGYLIKRKGVDWNMPTQKSMEMGLFEIKETPIPHSDGHISVNKTSRLLEKVSSILLISF